MIDIRKLKELVRLMVGNDLTEIDLRDSEEQVTLRRPSLLETPQVTHTPVVTAPQPAPATANGSSAGLAPPASTPETVTDSGLTAIESPMVGTFYATPDPDAAPFIQVGDHVNADTVICLVEAMKIFNEIKAEIAGTVEKLCVKSGDAVEFGETLFLVRLD